MTPDRILPALDDLMVEVRALRAEVQALSDESTAVRDEAEKVKQEAEDLRAQHGRFRVYVILLAVVAVLSVASIIGVLSVALQNRHSAAKNARARCEQTNASRAAIRAADRDRGDNLVKTVDDFTVSPTDPLLIRVREDNRRIIANLAATLPPQVC